MSSLTPAPPPEPRRYLAADMAERLGHSPDYWLRAARRREVPHRKIGRSIWWEEEDLQQILNSARVEPIDPLRSQTALSRARSER